MRKFAATACLALLLIGCERTFQDPVIYEGMTTQQWVEDLSDENNVERRRKAAVVLGELGLSEAEETVEPLAKACSDPDLQVRLNSLRSLEKLAPKAKKAEGAVGRAMSDKNKTVLKQAIRTYKAIEMARPSALNGGA
jgi:HEAT repeat protein